MYFVYMQLYTAQCTESVLFVPRGYFICGEYWFYILYLWMKQNDLSVDYRRRHFFYPVN